MSSLKRFLCTSVLAMIFAATNVLSAKWTQESSPTLKDLYGLAEHGGRFVAVGDSGTIITSTDGTSWSQCSSGTQVKLFGVCASSGQFVAVGDSLTILTSDNGLDWSLRSSHGYDTLYSVASMPDSFVAVGSGGTVLTSKDGSSWNRYSSGSESTLYSVAWTGSRLIAAGYYFWAYNCYGQIMSSHDGVNWIKDFDGTSKQIFNAIASYPQFDIALGRSGTSFSSNDDSTWTQRNSGTNASLNSVAWTGSSFIACGSSGTILQSLDGLQWSPETSTVTGTLKSIAASTGKIVAVGSGGAILSRASATPIVARQINTEPSSLLSNLSVSSFSIILDFHDAAPRSISGGIYDILGRLILPINIIRTNSNLVRIPTDGIRSGFYVLRLVQNGICETHSFVCR